MKKVLLYLTFAAIILGMTWLFRLDSNDPIMIEQTAYFFDDERYPAIRPLEAETGLSPKQLELGRKLFFDTRLSGDNSIACVSCHSFHLGGTDRLPQSLGVGGLKGNINAPTVFNSSLNFVQFWDGRAPTLETQIAGPVHNPVEMDSSWQQILERLSTDHALVNEFKQAYSDGLTINNLTHAIATFERSLITPDAPFDLYLRGNESALSKQQLTGFQLFRNYGCTSCHQGALLGGNMYQKFGVLGNYFANRLLTSADYGRYNVTGLEEDMHVFKVPSLRNVALTPPYFHDGSANTLEAAVTIMARYQLGKELQDKDLQAIVAFLHSLTGKQPDIGNTP